MTTKIKLLICYSIILFCLGILTAGVYEMNKSIKEISKPMKANFMIHPFSGTPFHVSVENNFIGIQADTIRTKETLFISVDSLENTSINVRFKFMEIK